VNPTIIAVAAPVGGGKSTLVRGLAERLPAASAIFLDHYERFTQQPVEEMRRWLRDGANPDTLAIPGLAEDLASLKNGLPVADPLTGNTITPGRYLLLETQFGRRHAATGRHIDFLVWIDTPLDLALARKLRQLAAGIDERDAAFVPWLRGYLESYLELVSESLRVQRDTVRAQADLIVDGMQQPAAVLAQVESAVLGRRS
jgi:uridine kinase